LIIYLVIAIEAIILEQYLVSLLAFVASFMLISTNLVFGYLYKKCILSDASYKSWVLMFPKTKLIVPFLIIFVNFKFIRFVFSGFFGLDNCMAIFKNPNKNIHRQLKLSTFFKYVFVYIPIFAADILIFSRVQWGH